MNINVGDTIMMVTGDQVLVLKVESIKPRTDFIDNLQSSIQAMTVTPVHTLDRK